MGILSNMQSIYLSALFPSLYVGSIYLRKRSRLHFAPNPKRDLCGSRIRVDGERWRDDDLVIRTRLYAVCFSTLCSLMTVAWAIISYSPPGPTKFLIIKSLGLVFPESPLLAFSLIPILYTGPLLSRYLHENLPFQRHWSLSRNLLPVFKTHVGLRNFVVAPVTEELVFRSCVLAVMLHSDQSPKKMIFLSPLWFGVAHLHHVFEMYEQNGRTRRALKQALVICAIQFSYTTLFGWLAAFLWLRTGSVLPCITSHIFCNLMGLPSPGGDSQNLPRYKVVIWTVYVAGILSFIVCIWKLML